MSAPSDDALFDHALPDTIADIIGAAMVGDTAGPGGWYPVADAQGTARWWLRTSRAGLLRPVFDRLEWLVAHLRCPRPIAYESSVSGDVLLVEPLAGQSAEASEQLVDPEGLIDALADGLRELHSLDPALCPFASHWSDIVIEVGARHEAGECEVEDLDSGLQPIGIDRAVEILATNTPDHAVDPVVTHGDFRPANVHLDADGFVGLLGASRLGVGDRYVDLGVMAGALGRWMGPDAAGLFIRRYDIDRLDAARLDMAMLAHGLRGGGRRLA